MSKFQMDAMRSMGKAHLLGLYIVVFWFGLFKSLLYSTRVCSVSGRVGFQVLCFASAGNWGNVIQMSMLVASSQTKFKYKSQSSATDLANLDNS